MAWPAAPLVPWQSDQPVWRIFPTGGRQQWDPEGPLIRIGSFLRGMVEGGSPAILVQEGAIVGWIPGAQLAGAWLWAGPDEDRLQGASLKEFQRAEFDGGQIAEARKVLDRNLSDLDALQGVARARGRPQILSESEIPPPRKDGGLRRSPRDTAPTRRLPELPASTSRVQRVSAF